MSLRALRPTLAVARAGLRTTAMLPLTARLSALPTTASRRALTLSARPQALVRTTLRSSRRFASTTASEAGPSSGGPGDEAKQSAYQRFKQLTKTYGSYAVIMYLALSAVDFSLVFAVVHSVGADSIEPYFQRIMHYYRKLRHGEAGAAALEAAAAAQKRADEAEEAAQVAIYGKARADQHWWQNKTLWAEIVLSYTIHKTLLLPVRAGLTVAWTPKVVNWLRARGWIGTAGAKRAAQHGADRMRSAGQRAMDQAKTAVKRGGD